MVSNEKMLEMLKDCKFDNLKKALEENLREECLKTSGRKNIAAIIKRLIKSIESINPRLKHVYNFSYDGIDYNGIVNGHMVIADVENIFNLDAGNDIDLKKCFPDNCDNWLEIDLSDLKYFKKTMDKKDKKPYVMEWKDKKIGFNPSYMLDCLEFCGTNKIRFGEIKSNCLKSPMIIESEDKKQIALLLPVNIK